ncbi:ArsR/SmtB family transcription factor [Eremococcus coleocola]|nr:metalloregulator ArsR/SmtB family transcription factor [Eremococcus coleocola]
MKEDDESMEDYQILDDKVIDKKADEFSSYCCNAELEKKANLFKVLGDQNRLKILEILLQHDELCVYEISRIIDATVATTSHHLITLRKNNFIESKKKGKHVLYWIEDVQVKQLLEAASI